MTLSVIIITKNEEQDLPRLLRSIGFATEIIVVDSGSTDNTVNIAKEWGARVYELEWEGFGPQKNRALSYASCDWVMSLDGDEWLPQETIDRILEITARGRGAEKMQAVSFPRCSFLLGKIVSWGDWRRDRVIRLFQRSAAYFSDDLIHERLVCRGKIFHASSPIFHEPFKSTADFEEKARRYNKLSAARLAECGRGGLASAVAHSCFALLRGLVLRLGFLDGQRGVLIAWFNAKGTFYKYYWAGKLRRSRDSG